MSPKYTHTLPYPLMTVPPAERCDKSPCPAKSEPSHNFYVLRPNASWMESIVLHLQNDTSHGLIYQRKGKLPCCSNVNVFRVCYDDFVNNEFLHLNML
ncbi:hypothetical protein CDAR_124551 [Caerostris darwini]|uniref:Uncharacterized protein n=1 Tax=Caerostris darwini TaxID=1538125 RepID=A0AAV4RM47_9ARAC|nr:hypothetical protein CDAR_124551 [Caerostris darwini]